ncbi:MULTISPECIES: ferritin family protein [Clostridium]|jgi:rubrerythrin|uniref:Predicted rubrerythrin n=3 Tax=Clostridium TaxID=1485 RepID=D8GP61_CLOLD|nr:MULTISPECIES: ferritin family protein [Clostridium]ADK15939.1 predicted rubrerythrin [Clostridium ljungdahlii DSM 13528]AGY75114.1 rubrerythrin family protein [Clostridium autoethanogenum DSM 10061]ALU35285.1 Rubrerythrin [Clostridium autoethanogenum DSM 10061]OAA87183.1 Reverse rubrerythrin-1 [Clostridium ljungdahlii DSM 13528]OVY49636.1 Reverse rubrerythrin-1 [Clostridium autoethanogenum]
MEDVKLSYETTLGDTKGTNLERSVKQTFNGETKEAGLYTAIARQAQRQGYGDIAEILKVLAKEEVEHAATCAELNNMITNDCFEDIKQMLEGEIFANNAKHEDALKAEEQKIDAAKEFFNSASKDEGRHARILEGILKKYNK